MGDCGGAFREYSPYYCVRILLKNSDSRGEQEMVLVFIMTLYIYLRLFQIRS